MLPSRGSSRAFGGAATFVEAPRGLFVARMADVPQFARTRNVKISEEGGDGAWVRPDVLPHEPVPRSAGA